MDRRTRASRKAHVPLTCVSCHKLPKFCKCHPGAVATCPICGKPQAEGEHFPKIDCYPRAVVAPK